MIANVETYRLDDPEVLHEVLGRMGDFVIKPVDGAGGAGIVIGPQADEATLDELSVKVSAHPRASSPSGPWPSRRIRP